MFENDFNIDYICFDGGSSNRAFQLIHFKDKEDAKANNYTTVNPYQPTEKVSIIMDYSHNVKKFRKNIHSSGMRDVPGN